MVRNSSSPDISVCTVQYIINLFVLIRFRLVFVCFFQFQRDVIKENRNKRNIYPADFRFLSSGSPEFQLVFLLFFFLQSDFTTNDRLVCGEDIIQCILPTSMDA